MISFGANLIIDKSVYNNAKTPEARKSLDCMLSEYEKFVNHPNFEAMTKEDTIELYKPKGGYKFAIEMKMTTPKFKKPYVTGIYSAKSEPCFKAFDLIIQSLMFLCEKKGETPRFSDTIFTYIDRVLFDNKLWHKRK